MRQSVDDSGEGEPTAHRRHRSRRQTGRRPVRSDMWQQKRNEVRDQPDLRAKRESEWQCQRPEVPIPQNMPVSKDGAVGRGGRE
jgi:hypothetical protein